MATPTKILNPLGMWPVLKSTAPPGCLLERKTETKQQFAQGRGGGYLEPQVVHVLRVVPLPRVNKHLPAGCRQGAVQHKDAVKPLPADRVPGRQHGTAFSEEQPFSNFDKGKGRGRGRSAQRPSISVCKFRPAGCGFSGHSRAKAGVLEVGACLRGLLSCGLMKECTAEQQSTSMELPANLGNLFRGVALPFPPCEAQGCGMARANLVYSKTHSLENFEFQSLAGAKELWPADGVT
jgi:hypothetical protein